MNSRRNEYQLATANLKRSLKSQGLTYREIAKRLGMSESGLKKIFTARDGSFQRLAQICQIAGLTMSELFEGDTEAMQDLSYSEKQQRLLTEDPKALALYWRLVYERMELSDAELAMGLTKKESFSLLRKLDEHDLLDLMPEGKVRVPAVRQIRWVGDGPLIRKLYREWSLRFISTVAAPEPTEGAYFQIRYVKVTPKTKRDFIEALRELESEFVRRGIREMREESSDLEHLRWLCAADSRSFLD